MGTGKTNTAIAVAQPTAAVRTIGDQQGDTTNGDGGDHSDAVCSGCKHSKEEAAHTKGLHTPPRNYQVPIPFRTHLHPPHPTYPAHPPDPGRRWPCVIAPRVVVLIIFGFRVVLYLPCQHSQQSPLQLA